MPYEVYKKYGELMHQIHKNPPMAVDSLADDVVHELLFWELITVENGLIFQTDKLYQRCVHYPLA